MGLFATCVHLWGNLPVRLATQRKSLRKFNLPLLASPFGQGFRQNDYLIKSVHKRTYLGRKHNKFPQSAARGFKVEQHNRQYMQPRFYAAQ